MSERVVVGMSGGVDSSVVAALLQWEGYEVIGATLHLYDNPLGGKTCCSIDDVYDAKLVANDLGIPHYVIDRANEFRHAVIDEFVQEYHMGITPLPCATCNKSVKIKELVKFADSIGAKWVATGHYAKIEGLQDGWTISMATDLQKDQTYFLSLVCRGDLMRLWCPLGKYQKAEVREMATQMGLVVSAKRESQDICFVPNGKYAEVVNRFSDKSSPSGEIRHIMTGELLGQHDGLINYTIGQRKGVKVSYGNPLYVCKIDINSNVLFVGDESSLYNQALMVSDFNSLVPNFKELAINGVSVKIRASASKVDAKVAIISDRILGNNEDELSGLCVDEAIEAKQTLHDDENVAQKKRLEEGASLLISLDARCRSITPGQVCAVYLGERLMGGGKIKCVIDDDRE